MEVRGVGIINIKDMFGVAAVRDEKKDRVGIELVRWREWESGRPHRARRPDPPHSRRVGAASAAGEPGRNVSSLVEVAARKSLAAAAGHHSAREFQERLDQALADAQHGASVTTWSDR